MGSGNYTFGMKPTYLTKASCAVMDVCELVPSQEGVEEYYQAPEETVTGVDVSLSCAEKRLQVCVRPTRAGARLVKSVNIYIQDPPYELNRDYDAVAFCAQRAEQAGDLQGPGFTCSVPLEELAGLTSDERQISVLLTLPNGYRYRWNAQLRIPEIREGESVPLYGAQFIEDDR